MGIFKRKFNKSFTVSDSSTPYMMTINGDLTFPTAAVGEDYTKDAIIDLVSKHAVADDIKSGRLFIRGVVRPEPSNKYDPHALVVLIDGAKVGYIAADRTTSFRYGVIRLMEETGTTLAHGGDWIADFAMRIGWKPDEEYPRYGVAIDTPAGFYPPFVYERN